LSVILVRDAPSGAVATLLCASCLYSEDNMLVLIKIDEISGQKEPLKTNKDKNSKSKWIN
jgi:hypothetical protein